MMLKTAREKAKQVVEKFRKMKLALAARKIVDRIEKTLTYINSPTQHWTRIETIIPLRDLIEKSRAELKQSRFSDGQCALILVCARLRHVAGTQ